MLSDCPATCISAGRHARPLGSSSPAPLAHVGGSPVPPCLPGAGQRCASHLHVLRHPWLRGARERARARVQPLCGLVSVGTPTGALKQHPQAGPRLLPRLLALARWKLPAVALACMAADSASAAQPSALAPGNRASAIAPRRWGLGVLTYVLLTGRQPFSSPKTDDPMVVMRRIVDDSFQVRRRAVRLEGARTTDRCAQKERCRLGALGVSRA